VDVENTKLEGTKKYEFKLILSFLYYPLKILILLVFKISQTDPKRTAAMLINKTVFSTNSKTSASKISLGYV